MQHEIAAAGDNILLRQASPSSAAASGEPACGPPAEVAASDGSLKLVRWIINVRAMRPRFFDEQLFADPAWDMLLQLYALQCEGRRISVSKLSVAAGVPCTTTLRWIDKLESESLVFRTADPLDARRVWIALSDLGLATMRSYIEHVSASGFPI